MKTCFRFLLRVWFRFRAYDLAALKTPGPVLLIPNHCSWLDWLFLWVCLDEDWKMATLNKLRRLDKAQLSPDSLLAGGVSS